MQEQFMVSDALNSINAGLKSLGDMISQTENQELRQTLQKMRNEAETCQYELFTIATSKNYYQPAQKATQDEITTVKNFVNKQPQSTQGQSQTTGQGMNQGMGQSMGQSSGQSQGMGQASGQTQGMGQMR